MNDSTNGWTSLIQDIAELLEMLASALSPRPDIIEKVSKISESLSAVAYQSAKSTKFNDANDLEEEAHQIASTTLYHIEHDAVENLSASLAKFLSIFKEADRNAQHLVNGHNAKASNANFMPNQFIPQFGQASSNTDHIFVGQAIQTSPTTVSEMNVTTKTFKDVSSYPNGEASTSYLPKIPSNRENQIHTLIPQQPLRSPFIITSQQVTHETAGSTSREIKERLEAAKALYRAEKEKFKKLKEERRNKKREYEERLARERKL